MVAFSLSFIRSLVYVFYITGGPRDLMPYIPTVRLDITLLRSTFSAPFLLAFFVTSALTSSLLDMSILRRLLLRLYNGFGFDYRTGDKLANNQADVR
jgi:hypothetical protein